MATQKLITLSTAAKCLSYIKDKNLVGAYIINRASHTYEVWVKSTTTKNN